MIEVEKRLKIDFHASLRDGDTAEQTNGCRANNPDICANNMIPNICAFSSSDGICRRPSRAWAKQFKKLSE